MENYQDVTSKNIYTPWGRADYEHKRGEGVMFYVTPSHGGYHLSEERQAQVKPECRTKDGFYEEDCEWCVVALTFPDLFSEEDKAHAEKTWQACYGETGFNDFRG